MYRDAYNDCQQDFFICDSLVNSQSRYITRLEQLKAVQDTRLTKFQSILYTDNGKQRKPLKVFFLWKLNRKSF